MKFILSVLTILFIVSLSSSQVDKRKIIQTKTFKNENIIVKYPKTWKHRAVNAYVFIEPKGCREINSSVLCHVSADPEELQWVITPTNTEKYLIEHAETLNRHERSKTFEITKLPDDSKFVYKIEYAVFLDYNEDAYKKAEFFYLKNSKLRYYSFIARKDVFEKYYDEAMFIINSIKER